MDDKYIYSLYDTDIHNGNKTFKYGEPFSYFLNGSLINPPPLPPRPLRNLNLQIVIPEIKQPLSDLNKNASAFTPSSKENSPDSFFDLENSPDYLLEAKENHKRSNFKKRKVYYRKN